MYEPLYLYYLFVPRHTLHHCFYFHITCSMILATFAATLTIVTTITFYFVQMLLPRNARLVGAENFLPVQQCLVRLVLATSTLTSTHYYINDTPCCNLRRRWGQQNGQRCHRDGSSIFRRTFCCCSNQLLFDSML